MDSTLFSLAIVTPEKDFFESEVNEVVFSTSEGSVGIMAGHEPLFAAVSEGVVEIFVDGEWKIAAVGQGFCEVSYHKTKFYLDTAEWADEIDIVRAKEALERAAQRIQSSLSQLEYIRTQAALSRALARLKATESSAAHHGH